MRYMFDKLFDFGSTDAQRREREYNPRGLTKLTRQGPNGRLTEPEPDDTAFGVDRGGSGEFVSRERYPQPLIRDHDTGRLSRDPYAIGVSDPDEALDNMVVDRRR